LLHRGDGLDEHDLLKAIIGNNQGDDWANFANWAIVYFTYVRGFMKDSGAIFTMVKLMYQFLQKWVGLHFGQFLQLNPVTFVAAFPRVKVNFD
jgi:hypothetical protein